MHIHPSTLYELACILRVGYCMVWASVREDNPRALANGLSSTQTHKSYILAWEFVTRRCLKPQNPCSNHEIHVLFEHDFYLKKSKLGPDLYA